MRFAILLFCSIVLTVIGATTMLQAQQPQDPMLLWDRVRDRLLSDHGQRSRHSPRQYAAVRTGDCRRGELGLFACIGNCNPRLADPLQAVLQTAVETSLQ